MPREPGVRLRKMHRLVAVRNPRAPGLVSSAVPPRAPPIPRGASSKLILPTVSYVLGMSAQATFFFFLAPAYTRATGTSSLDVAVFTLSALATMSASLHAGRLSDSIGRRPVMRAGWWAMTAASAVLAVPFVYPLGLAAWWIVLATMLMGVGLALSFVAYMSYVADLTRAEHEQAVTGALEDGAPRASALARSYGVSSALAVLASAVGPFAGAAIVGAAPDAGTGILRATLLLAAMSGAAALLSYALPTLRPLGQPGPKAKPDWARFIYRPKYSGDRAVMAMNVIFLVMGIGYGATAPYFALHFLDTVRLDAASWGALLGVGTVVGGLAVLVAGAVAGTGKFTSRTLLLTITGATLVVLVPYPFVVAPAGLAAMYLARSAFANMPGPIINGVLMTSADRDVRGAAMGASTFLWNLGWAIGALVGGVGLALVGPWLFPAGGALGVVAVVIGLALLPERPPPIAVVATPPALAPALPESAEAPR